ncbi:cytosolic carboxypeptidase 2 isoform X2 [Nothobranchius furzeri]|uniref:Cytosolic carboxypeptidase 2 n=1 Tax=Nothobranchius furzeri TaxID=105023 RepID=A0A9D2YSK6_NOTFU|nr:transcript variant X2 [Nothobranchius furzeri]
MTEAVKTSTIAASVRNLWNSCRLDKLDINDSNTKEDELAARKQLSVNLSQTLRTRQLLINFSDGRPVLTLSEPLDIVNFPTSPRSRWPIECEIIGDIIQHIEWEPPEPEPFYQASGHEEEPMPVGEERGKVVYSNDPAIKHHYFTFSRFGGSTRPERISTSQIHTSDVTLEFESRFESGNLQKAIQVGIHDYELTLRTDMYTAKHTQWFYFRIRNTRAGVTYRFTITNLMKRRSLYSQGLKPLLYSERAAKENGVGWQRAGSGIRYYRNISQARDENSDSATLFSLTWTLQFPYDSDTCYLAHCYPYTYSRLQRYLQRISSNPTVMSFCKLRVLCQSLAGNAVYVMTITSRQANRLNTSSKKAVVVTARVHPGETNGSWVMEGFLDFLLGDSEDAQILRDNFVFKVVPMLNPDGVVVGNYRCSLAGRDLNRNYKTLLKDSFPCVWHTRDMVKRLMADTEVLLYCDFHGHNRKNNVFMYGCSSRGDASLTLKERVFPLMMSKNASNKFSFKSCKFRVEKNKEGTGRISMWKLGIRNSYTMEATFGGSTLDDRRGTHFSTQDLKSLGFNFCDTLLDFCDPDKTKVTHCLTELATMLGKKVRERTGKDVGTDQKVSVSELETSTGGSNSSDSDGLPVHLLQQLQNAEKKVKKKKKRLKSRRERNGLQPDGARSSARPKVLQRSSTSIEADLPQDNTDKQRKREKPVGGERRKQQLNTLIKKVELSSPTGNHGDASQGTLRKDCKHILENCSGSRCTSCLQRRASPHADTRAAASPHSGDAIVRGQWKCSSQLLHLSALLPLPPTFIPSAQHQRFPLRQSLSHSQVCRGLTSPFAAPGRCPPSLSTSMAPAVVPKNQPLTSFTSTNTSSRHRFRNRSCLQASSTSNTNLIKTKQ